jgi:hypothetical protein
MTVENGGKLCIVNLQVTEKDRAAEVRVFDYCDHFIEELAKGLGIEIPKYQADCDFVVQKKSLCFNAPFYDMSFVKRKTPQTKRGKVKDHKELVKEEDHYLTKEEDGKKPAEERGEESKTAEKKRKRECEEEILENKKRKEGGSRGDNVGL